MRFLLTLGFVLLHVGAHAQSEWTLAPTFGGGFAWSDGQRDYVGDDAYPAWATCESPATVPGTNTPCWRRVALPYGRVAPTFTAGVLATRALPAHLVWTAGLAFTAGATHRFVDEKPNAGLTEVVHGDHVDFYTPDVRIAVRVTSTLRLRLGRRARGFVGAGGSLGWVDDIARARDSSFPWGPSIDPDEGSGPRSSPFTHTRGFTAEALLEAGAVFAPQHLSLSIVVAGGRPLVRTELVLAIPFRIGRGADR